MPTIPQLNTIPPHLSALQSDRSPHPHQGVRALDFFSSVDFYFAANATSIETVGRGKWW